MQAVSIDHYDHFDGLQELLTDLTGDVDRLITYIDSLHENWTAVDVRRYRGFFEALVTEESHPRFYQSLAINSEFSVLFMALTEELIDIDTLCRAVAAEHMGDTNKIRFILSTGVRTYASKQLGFRWGERAQNQKEVMQDCKKLATFIRDVRPGQHVSSVTADYEQITIYFETKPPYKVPLDQFPFLGAARARDKRDAEMVQKINYEIGIAEWRSRSHISYFTHGK